jgi:hypothetical protein
MRRLSRLRVSAAQKMLEESKDLAVRLRIRIVELSIGHRDATFESEEAIHRNGVV